MTYEQIKNLCSKLAPSTAALDDNPADVDGNEDRLSKAVESAELETQLSGPANPGVDFRTNLNNNLYQHEQRGLGRDG
jgi:hypothetical protein